LRDLSAAPRHSWAIDERRAAAVEPISCHDRRVNRVLRQITQDRLERAYFSKRFHSVMKVSFTEWNARVRVEEAKLLLRSIDLSITAIGACVGYDDVTTFERVFKRLEGICPRAHRRRITQNAETATLNAETSRAPRT
jgi:AraC-like DNA-binding protein